ncbi:hypothetical protein QSU92_16055 [Microbacterium sp. ET2]|uniref:hypothetical protein n=1 Tax=Microbacterium albipurpureum TaxID=3050384 RepID=UPI00259CECDD|nr:hypothetical protein [Microbacterium sp. ET2 (Ac-2212)]WJL95421.1 hypothetical protein QSU92_16055 [Microbacterium sp. ET2 (Ac-2212)]
MSPVPTSAQCNDVGTWTSTCIENTGTEVNVGASTGSGGGGSQAGVTPRGGGSESVDVAEAAEPDCVVELGRCDIDYQVEAPPEVTIEDLASFRPATPRIGGEPAGFGVVGMPTNVYASAGAQEIPGEILGWDVVVRFEPAAYVFSYGDGTTGRSASGGASWSVLGQPQFTPTATSHVYAQRGVYPVSVTVEYTAAVTFGSTWRSVPGVVTSSAGGYEVDVREVRTALVDRTCLEDPAGPGC